MRPVSLPCAARRVLGEFSPRAKRIASAMFDFPLPFGPVTTVRPCSKLIVTILAPNDLNPLTSSLRTNPINSDSPDTESIEYKRYKRNGDQKEGIIASSSRSEVLGRTSQRPT